MINSDNEKVELVTGETGFLGSHCIAQILQQGCLVWTTLRNLKRKDEVISLLQNNGIEYADKLTFYQADLTFDNGWEEAVAGCDYVLHVASPFPSQGPEHEDEIIIPAKEGTLQVLRMAQQEEIKRVVMTSSFAAVGYEQNTNNKIFTEDDWTNPENPNISAYVKSKTIAEIAAWNFIKNANGKLELTFINPVGIFGPLLGKDLSASIQLLKQLLDGKIKSTPKTYFNTVDVRDVALLHVKAMTHPKAAGERFLALAGKCLSVHDVAMILKNNLGARAKKVSQKELPNWQVRIASLFNPQAKQLLPELGKVRKVSNEKTKTIFAWSPRTNEEAILASAESLIKFGLIDT
jgi:nucleoside-diphosphate-sugar epimerase